MTNEELCERVLPIDEWDRTHVLTGADTILVCRADLAKALQDGILIPAERLLKVEEIAKILKNMTTLGDVVYFDIAQAIHQSSRQKAGVK